MLNRILAGLVCLAICLCGCPGSAAAETASPAPAVDVSGAADAIIACRMAADGAADPQAWLDGALSGSVGSGTEWYAFALCRRGGYDLTAYRAALTRYVQETAVPSASTRLKHAFILAACGSTDGAIAAALADSAGRQGIMSHVFALHLLHSGVEAPGLTDADTLSTLLGLQYADGGWALYGAASDPDVTAMTLQALAPHRADEEVAAAIDRALARLSALQRPDGDYASYGVTNPESTAQVIIALTALGIDPLSDERFIRDGSTLLDGMNRYRLPNGRYAHRLGDAANENATMQALLALTAMERLQAGLPGLYELAPQEAGPARPGQAAQPEASSAAAPQTAAPALPFKYIAAAVIAVLALAALLALMLMRTRRRSRYIAVLVAAALLIAFVCLTDFQSAEEYYSGRLPHKPDASGTVTLTIRCDRAIGQPGTGHLPADGVILAHTALPIAPGDTVFTVLTEAAQAFGVHVESSGGAGMRYITGIGNLQEFSCGDLSGWLYTVNGASPSVGCDQYSLQDGDAVVWAYSLDMGGDLNLR